MGSTETILAQATTRLVFSDIKVLTRTMMWICKVLLCILTSAKTTKASLTNTVKRRQHLVNYAYVSSRFRPVVP